MGAKWYGFVDPQSGLDRYVWWAGTTKGGSEVLAPREIHLTEVATAVNFTSELPLNKRIYITVRAYNKAGGSKIVWTFNKTCSQLINPSLSWAVVQLTLCQNLQKSSNCTLGRTLSNRLNHTYSNLHVPGTFVCPSTKSYA